MRLSRGAERCGARTGEPGRGEMRGDSVVDVVDMGTLQISAQCLRRLVPRCDPGLSWGRPTLPSQVGRCVTVGGSATARNPAPRRQAGPRDEPSLCVPLQGRSCRHHSLWPPPLPNGAVCCFWIDASAEKLQAGGRKLLRLAVTALGVAAGAGAMPRSSESVRHSAGPSWDQDPVAVLVP